MEDVADVRAPRPPEEGRHAAEGSASISGIASNSDGQVDEMIELPDARPQAPSAPRPSVPQEPTGFGLAIPERECSGHTVFSSPAANGVRKLGSRSEDGSLGHGRAEEGGPGKPAESGEVKNKVSDEDRRRDDHHGSHFKFLMSELEEEHYRLRKEIAGLRKKLHLPPAKEDLHLHGRRSLGAAAAGAAAGGRRRGHDKQRTSCGPLLLQTEAPPAPPGAPALLGVKTPNRGSLASNLSATKRVGFGVEKEDEKEKEKEPPAPPGGILKRLSNLVTRASVGLNFIHHGRASEAAVVPMEPVQSESEARSSVQSQAKFRPGRQSTVSTKEKAQARLSSHALVSNELARNFKTYDCWAPRSEDTSKPSRHTFATSRSKTMNVAAHLETKNEELTVITSKHWASRFVLHPASNKRLIWDLVGFTLLAYDILSIPFVVAFEPADHLMQHILDYSTLMFWTCDFMLAFLTGFHTRFGTIMMVPGVISRRYMRSWMLMDLPVLLIDYSTLVTKLAASTLDSGETTNVSMLGRSLKTLRFARSIRLLRVMKLKHIIEKIQDKINSESLSIYFGLAGSLVAIVVANHIIACLWYYIGITMWRDFEDDSWVAQGTFLESSLAYRYTTSLQWSLTQFTPASMEVVPKNTAERVVAVMVLLVGCIGFSSIVSTITASMNKIRAIHSEESKQFWLLRRYLRQMHICELISSKVRRYCEYAWERQRAHVQEKEVELLNILSEPLRQELMQENFSPHLNQHPFFNYLNMNSFLFVKSLQALAMARGDLVFCFEQQAQLMYISVSGVLAYTVGEDQGDGEMWGGSEESGSEAEVLANGMGSQTTIQIEDVVSERVDKGEWICEAVLWTPWEHLGDMQTLTECQLIAISAASFQTILQSNRSIWFLARKYAQVFVANMNQLEGEELTDLSGRMLSAASVFKEAKLDPAQKTNLGSTLGSNQHWREFVGSIAALFARTRSRTAPM